jgi:hypothetical protein
VRHAIAINNSEMQKNSSIHDLALSYGIGTHEPDLEP